MPRQPTTGPTMVGQYRLLGRIGEGGMGVVYLAARPNGEHAAIKLLRPALVGDQQGRERLAREVTSLRRVQSPRIAEVFDADPWGDIPYVVTRYVAGPSLREVVDARGGLSGRPLHTIARGLAEALVAVHRAEVLHRDVKPSNVLIEDGEPVLIDFGLAQLVDDVTLTQVGFLLGTPGYLAPEIIEGAQPSRAADVHGWAATVVYAASGAGPYGRGIAAATLERARHGDPDLSGVPVELRDIVTASLRRDPGNRPSAQQLVDWLAATAVPGGGAGRGSVDEIAAWFASTPRDERPLPEPDLEAFDPLADWDILAPSPDGELPTDTNRVAADAGVANTTVVPPLGGATQGRGERRRPEGPDPVGPAASGPLGDDWTNLVGPDVESRTRASTREQPLPAPSEAAPPTPHAAPVVGGLRGAVLLVSSMCLAASLTAAAPALAALVGAISIWGLRTLSVAAEAWWRRRDRRGPGGGERTLVALRLPLHALEAAAATLVSMLMVGLCVTPFVLFGLLGPASARVPFLAVAGIVGVAVSAAWTWGLQVRQGAKLLAARAPSKGSSLALLAIGALAVTTALLATEQIVGTSYFPF